MSAKKSLFFELRSGTIDMLLFVVKTTNLAEIRAELSRRFDATPGFFSNDVVAIDVRQLSSNQHVLIAEMAEILREFKMYPAGIVANEEQRSWAQFNALPFIKLHERLVLRSDEPEAVAPPWTQSFDIIAQPQNASADRTEQSSNTTTLVIDKPLRSGQQIYAKGDLVILGLVSHGAEVIAEGNIHIYAPLRGRALAGVYGNYSARIFCTCLEPELISIAGIYRTTEMPLSPDLLGMSVQIRLADEKLIIEPLRLT
ncbi:septum site-determining protein MinC [Candidatus Vallotia cooleyia]|uniref:septum site-determining protein MinC n=1 Tax=Candidatus Vallotiella adelgis TaxID=1177211 RepID=UPI001D01A902|nr:septum site-determining protein MinC [Candidatus Vallotia cooleyia]UDG82092.1 Septum site-determining protein MinC [Candidatus Vallotia cooleyia]